MRRALIMPTTSRYAEAPACSSAWRKAFPALVRTALVAASRKKRSWLARSNPTTSKTGWCSRRQAAVHHERD